MFQCESNLFVDGQALFVGTQLVVALNDDEHVVHTDTYKIMNGIDMGIDRKDKGRRWKGFFLSLWWVITSMWLHKVH